MHFVLFSSCLVLLRPENPQVFQAISKVVVEGQSNGIIASPPPIVGRIHQEMGLGMTKLQNAMCLGKDEQCHF